MADSSHRWFLALGGAALLLSASLGGLVLLRRRQAQASPVRSGPGADCGPQRSEFHPLPGAESPPVILWAAGAARLFIDEQAAFSPPESPRRFAPGEHSVRIEAPGEETLRTRVRVGPFTPALLHAQVDPEIGLSLVRLGAGCPPCEPPSTPVDLSPVPSPSAGIALLKEAAGHLRHDRWLQAADGIRRAATADRARPIFFRLASITAGAGGQPELARALLEQIPAAKSNDLASLLPALDALSASEARRRQEVALGRWNKLTEWFAALGARFQGGASPAVAAATRRFAQLSPAFESAVREGAPDRQGEVIRAGEEALTALVKELRALRPEDCQFQAALSAVGGP